MRPDDEPPKPKETAEGGCVDFVDIERRKPQDWKAEEAKEAHAQRTQKTAAHPVKKTYLDIETAPALGYFYERYDVRISPDQIVHNGFILCIQWAIDDGPVCSSSLRGLGVLKPEDDRPLLERVVALIESSDVVIAHNAKRFDLARINARLAAHKMKPYAPPEVVDTLQICRKKFKFEANSLDSVCQELGLGRKFHSGGFETTLACMKGSDEAWAKLVKYGEHDVTLLRDLYKAILPWIGTDHPNQNLYSTTGDSLCPSCGSSRIRWRGERHTRTMSYHRFVCNDCGTWGRSRKTFLEKEKKDAIVMSV